MLDFAARSGLQLEAFAARLDSAAAEAEVDANLAEAIALDVQAAPTIFINGRKAVGRAPWPKLKRVIDFEFAAGAGRR